VDDILREFFDIRMGFYEKRREYMLGLLEAEASKLSNQARFILEKCDNKLSIENKKRKVMVQELISKKYDPDPVAIWKEKQEKLNLEEDEDDAQEDAEEEDDENETDEEKKKRKKTKDDGEALDPQAKMYDYLLGMKLWSLTLESKERLLRERDSKIKELEDLKKKSPRDLYR
jgi:DNA topoisomerase-2